MARAESRRRRAVLRAPATWPETLTQKWRIEVGTGYATPLVVGNRVYVFSRQGENEVMTALDADTGKEVWKNPGYTAHVHMMSRHRQHGPGPKSTPVFSNGRLYSIGMTGIVTAWDAATGKQVWQKPGSTSRAARSRPMRSRRSWMAGSSSSTWADTTAGSLTAFDVNTGAEKWSWKGDGPGYGSPVAATLGGTRQIIAITQKTLVSVDAATGAVLWERPVGQSRTSPTRSRRSCMARW